MPLCAIGASPIRADRGQRSVAPASHMPGWATWAGPADSWLRDWRWLPEAPSPDGPLARRNKLKRMPFCAGREGDFDELG
jgi:hypothetical protein